MGHYSNNMLLDLISRPKRNGRLWIKSLLCIYVVVLVWVVLMKTRFSFESLMGDRALNLIPFYLGDTRGLSNQLTEFILNLLFFVPLGVYLSMLDQTGRMAVITGALFSLALEITQYCLGIGAADINDLIANTAGCAIGVGIYFLLKLFCNRKKLDLSLKAIATVGTVFALLLVAHFAAIRLDIFSWS